MQRRDFLLTGAAFGTSAFMCPSPVRAQTTSPVVRDTALPLVQGGVYQAGSQAQLFVDQMVVRSTDKVTFRLHPARKHPANPLVRADQPWEGWGLSLYGNVIFDEAEKRFKMWYICESPEYFPKYAALYATSEDGIHWEKPLIGTVASEIAKHNAVLDKCEQPNVIKDDDDPDPARRYKMFAYLRPHGYHTLVSPDGLHWTQYSEKPICPHEDVITGYYDRQRKLWIALPKTHAAVVPGLPHQRRVFSLATSADFTTWSEPELVLYPDAKDDAGAMARIEEVRPLLDVPDDPALVRTEFYGMGVYQAESCTLGFPWVFTINNNGRFGNHEGPSELQLAVSRDLKHWERPFRISCVPRGTPQEWDCGFFVTGAEALRVKDEVWLYYGGSNYLHGTPCLFRAKNTGRKTRFTASIGLATWPLDRFVSADGPANGGTLTTVPLAFTGNRLELNVNGAPATQSGVVRVELLDAAGVPLQGFGLSDAVTSDSLRETVTWKTKSDLSALRTRPVSLRFHLQNAELFSFAFRE